ncbi:WD40-repeat-containing domain [Pseudocohnilembus persalinus]|uniref:WD40-repeat-containing domain n=1 Tax=Pseudocohnilembus persalinus TaxID=266149 RepID=A0A0V0R9F9_PSEPJ|nr:WD40-repeat-containing domain [Pseudocohnilembus persalinus]|eukprot:KRX10938.1 WD40-repeat-containing domain [Pseudocohnilembus persalinus]
MYNFNMDSILVQKSQNYNYQQTDMNLKIKNIIKQQNNNQNQQFKTPEKKKKNLYQQFQENPLNSPLSLKKQRSSSSSNVKLLDRFIPNNVGSNVYQLLSCEKSENNIQFQKQNSCNSVNRLNQLNLNSQFETANTNNSHQQQQQNQQQQQLSSHEKLEQGRELGFYTNLLKQNILNDEFQDQENRFGNNCQIKGLSFQDISSSNKKDKVLKYRTNQKRNQQYILNYSPVKINNKNQNSKLEQNPQLKKISKAPFKILDAPKLRDDFYFNLLDWSSKNIIAVGLDNILYSWNPVTKDASKLAEIENGGTLTSLSWAPSGVLLARGDDSGIVKIFDTEKNICLRTYQNHFQRVGSLCWNNNLITSGGRDSKIISSDIRQREPFAHKFVGHKQEVCGTKWNYDGLTLASGGNDNNVHIWSLKMSKQLAKFTDHKAAVKALTWSPHQNNLLLTGGGTSDKTMKFWNINSLKLVNSIDTGSQICNMAFTKNANQFVTTHGFSMNQVAIWKINSNQNKTLSDELCEEQSIIQNTTSDDKIEKIATLYGHTYRVLYLAVSPDGENIVTGSGDESLRFWKVFPSSKTNQYLNKSQLNPQYMQIR